MLDHVIAEAVGEDLPWQGWDGDSGRLSFEDVAEVFEVGVATTNRAVLKFECRDIGSTDDFIVGVHAPLGAMGLGVFHLWKTSGKKIRFKLLPAGVEKRVMYRR